MIKVDFSDNFPTAENLAGEGRGVGNCPTLDGSVTVGCWTSDLKIVGLNPGRVAIKWLLLVMQIQCR